MVQYRHFGQLDWQPSALGFGAMRLPTIGDDSSNIDEDKAVDMIRHAIDNGVNYVDTACMYHDGASEPVVGKALDDGYREKVKLATKLSMGFFDKSHEGMEEFLEGQLEKLRTDHVDFYLLHGLNKERWEEFKELQVFDWLEDKVEEGKVRHLGFSFHGDYETFKEIIDGYDDWTMCQIQYNYMDKYHQATQKGLRYAAANDLAVVIMEPIRGGQLASSPPPAIRESEAWQEISQKMGPVEMALNWLWDQPEVSVALSGMSAPEHVEQNLRLADRSSVGRLSVEETRLIEEVGEQYNQVPVGCTACNYCMPCPNDVDIPGNFELYNDSELYERFEENREKYYSMDPGARASACVECGQCEEVCPQNLDVIDLLAETAEYFGDEG